MSLVKEIKSRDGKLHFRRWSLLGTRWFDVYLHCIYRSDEDNDPHDHPWNFASLILKGGYVERLWGSKGWEEDIVRGPGSFAYRTTAMFHKITLLGGPTWTLVVSGKRTHEPWGYRTSRGWIDHETYREEKHQRE